MVIVRLEGLSVKNSNDTIGNRTSDLPACSSVVVIVVAVVAVAVPEVKQSRYRPVQALRVPGG